ncbi:unnamed protein product [Gordionus sp. m RMFG-2023]|uniref:heat shock protein beta-1-like n=1 Tax=Gordionus sp. m RMFG-2023 TaxID=3053472 RepID=UPI0030DEB66A
MAGAKSNMEIKDMSSNQQPGQGAQGQFFIPYAVYNNQNRPVGPGGPMNENSMQQQSYFNIEASGGFPSGRIFPGLPLTFSPQAPPLLGPMGGETAPTSTIVFSTDPHLSSTTTTTTGIAEVKLDGNKMTISTNVSPFTPDKLEVKAADNKITIKAAAQEEKDQSGYIRTKEFHRQYLIPMGCDPEKMKCSYENGVLKIKVVIPERCEKLLPIEMDGGMCPIKQTGPSQQRLYQQTPQQNVQRPFK